MKQATFTIIILAATLPLFHSCSEKANSARPSAALKDSFSQQRISDSVSSANPSLPLDPHAEDMMRIIDKMNASISKAEHSGNFDMDFAKLMSIHHQASIEIAELQLRLGKDEKLKELAEDMSKLQKKQMGDFMGIIKDIRMQSATKTPDTSAATKSLSDSVFARIKSMSDSIDAVELTGDVDHDFMAVMIPVHQTSISITQFALKNSKHTKAKKLVHAITPAQQHHLKQLQAFQSKAGKQAVKKG